MGTVCHVILIVIAYLLDQHQQEAHGPHHSSEKQTFAQSNDYAITLRDKRSLSPF